MRSAVLVFGIVFAIAGSGCSSSGGGSEQKSVQADANPSASSTDTEYIASDAKGIQTITVKSSSVPDYLVLPAHIEADPTRVVHVFPPAGGRIVEMKVRPSDHVEKGQLLALLESSDLSRAVADYHKAKVDAEVKQQALTRAEDLLTHNAIAQKDYQQAHGDAKIAEAELEATAQHIRDLGMDPDHASTELRVVAPRSGVILDIGASTGEYSKSLDAPQPLCTIADISTVWALGDIYERDFATLKMGAEAQVTLDAYPNQHWAGRVGVLYDVVDPATRTLHLRVVLENPDRRIKPAMFGSIRVLRSSSAGILIPASAVIREGNEAHVFVSKGNGRFERRTVKLGRALDGSIEILSGINQGDSIVSEGALLLRAAAQS
ncbi:MAG: efflux RND transporter periplasmic adaptor subunit [Candidatus Acidiferrales bacterium]